jgi:hypothetical protein
MTDPDAERDRPVQQAPFDAAPELLTDALEEDVPE